MENTDLRSLHKLTSANLKGQVARAILIQQHE